MVAGSSCEERETVEEVKEMERRIVNVTFKLCAMKDACGEHGVRNKTEEELKAINELFCRGKEVIESLNKLQVEDEDGSWRIDAEEWLRVKERMMNEVGELEVEMEKWLEMEDETARTNIEETIKKGTAEEYGERCGDDDN